MVAMNTEKRDRQRADVFFLLYIPPAFIEVDPCITKNNHDVCGFSIHTGTEIGNTLEVAVGISGKINHMVPPFYECIYRTS